MVVNGTAFVRVDRLLSQARAVLDRGKVTGAVMIIEVSDGPAVTTKAVPQSRSYFRFFDGFHSGGVARFRRGMPASRLSRAPARRPDPTAG